jgi:hypothetical protein
MRGTVAEGLPSVSSAETKCRLAVSRRVTMCDNTEEGLLTLGNTEVRPTLL